MDVLSLDEKELQSILSANYLSSQVKSTRKTDDIDSLLNQDHMDSVKVLENFTSMITETKELEKSIAFNNSKKEFNNKEETIIRKYEDYIGRLKKDIGVKK